MRNSTKAMFGKRALGDISAYDYIDWAEEMLMQEYDSPSLRVLAGLDRHNDFREVESYFLRSIEELNIEETEIKVAIRAYACETAQKIIDDQFTYSKSDITSSRSHLISSQLGVMALSRIYYGYLWGDLDGDYSDYEIWLELNDVSGGILNPSWQSSVTPEDFDSIVKQEAAIFLAKMASSN